MFNKAGFNAVFQRLEKKKLIKSYYGDETQGGRRKDYKMTSLGNAFFKERLIEWKIAKKNIDIFMEEI